MICKGKTTVRPTTAILKTAFCKPILHFTTQFFRLDAENTSKEQSLRANEAKMNPDIESNSYPAEHSGDRSTGSVASEMGTLPLLTILQNFEPKLSDFALIEIS